MIAGSITRVAFRIAGCVALLLVLSSCSHRSESELEAIALSFAVEKVKQVKIPSLWPHDRFPLTVGFSTGPGLDGTGCVSGWRREFERYVRFMNAGRRPLLRLPSSAETEFDAMVYYGSFDEFESSQAYRIFRTWVKKPGITGLWTHKDHPVLPFGATVALGMDPVVRFGIRYAVLEPRSVEARGGCSATAQPSADLAVALMQTVPWAIRRAIERQYPGLEQQVGWRADRRLLLANQLMPPKQMERDEGDAAMVKALLSE